MSATVQQIEEYVGRAKSKGIDMELLRSSVKEAGWKIQLDGEILALSTLYNVFIALTYSNGVCEKPKPIAL